MFDDKEKDYVIIIIIIIININIFIILLKYILYVAIHYIRQTKNYAAKDALKVVMY
jgi:hypothetical protein